MPAGISVGDLLIVFFVNDGNVSVTVSTGSGWTQLGVNSMSPGVAARLSVYYKIATGTGDTIGFTTGASEGSAHVTYRITGFDANTAPEKDTVTATAVDANPNPPSLNPVNWDIEDTLWIAAYGWDGNNSHSAYPANYTSNQVTNRWANAGGVGVAVSTRNNAVASEDPGTATLSGSDDWGAFTIAVRTLQPATYSATADNLPVGGAECAATCTFTPPVFSATAPINASPATLTASATHNDPDYTGTAAPTVGPATLAANAAFSGGGGATTVIAPISRPRRR